MSQDSALHDSILKQVLEKFRAMGYEEFCVNLAGQREPKPIRGIKGVHIPDLTCSKSDPNRTQVVLDVETCESVFAEGRAERWTLFKDFCEKTSAEFHLIAPRVCDLGSGNQLSGEELLLRRLQELGIDPEGIRIWTVKLPGASL